MKKMLSIVLALIMVFYTPVYAEECDDRVEIRVCAVGDNLIHSRVYKSGLQEDGTYNFDDMYRFYSGYLNDYDICIVNQETVFVEDKNDFSAYPRFGGPEEVGIALMDAGFNVITTATNHVLDKGMSGMLYSHRFWTDWNIEPVGTHTNNSILDVDSGEFVEDRAVYSYVEGVTVGFLNYTYGTNGLSTDEGYEWMVDVLDSKENVKKDMDIARAKCDILIVLPHWGEEYQFNQNQYQTEWARFFADNGADVIIGTHPHVIQPLEYIVADDGKVVPCYYSLGNFISNQDEVARMLGAAATFTIIKDGDDVYVEDVKASPTVTHISCYSEYFYAKSLYSYTSSEEEEHRMRRIKGTEFSIDNLWKLWYSVFTEDQTSKL